MAFDSREIARTHRRFEVKLPIKVSGIDKAGRYFSAPAEAVNRCAEGMGLLLDRDLHPHTTLMISVLRDHRVLEIQTEVRHITPFDGAKKVVGVRFSKAETV